MEKSLNKFEARVVCLRVTRAQVMREPLVRQAKLDASCGVKVPIG
jgi:hypothetical protein